MAIIVLRANLTADDIQKAREEYPQYIKITVDLRQEIVVIGGEYHADAEKVLIDNYQSQQSDIWGGGYNIASDIFEVNAIINLRSGKNDSTDILDPVIRNRFLELVKTKLSNIKSII